MPPRSLALAAFLVAAAPLVAGEPVSFTREVEPVPDQARLQRGRLPRRAARPRRLPAVSLFGFDPAFDHAQIVAAAEGRRVVLSDPERSILLQKPTLVMEHGGGERFKAGSPRLRHRSAAGSRTARPSPARNDPTVTALEVWPRRGVHDARRDSSRSLVRAAWSDGRGEDVTAAGPVRRRSTTPSPPSRPAGWSPPRRPGETHVMVRFAGQATRRPGDAALRASSTVPATLPAEQLHRREAGRQVEGPGPDAVAAVRRRGVPPPLYLDAIGTLPTPDEVRAFLADTVRRQADEGDRHGAGPAGVRRLLGAEVGRPAADQPRPAAGQGHVELPQLGAGQPPRRQAGRRDGPRHHHRRGQHLHRGAGQLLPASAAPPTDWAETTAQLFLGVRMQCAKCHHHPFEKWSQDDYYGMAAFFVRLGHEEQPGVRPVRPRDGRLPAADRRGDAPAQGRRREAAPARRRRRWTTRSTAARKLAEWLTATDNPFFARNIVNRFWGYTDGPRPGRAARRHAGDQPAEQPRAARRPGRRTSSTHKYDLKHLLRTIFSSRAYQLDVGGDAGQPGRRGEHRTSRRYTRQAADGGAAGRRDRLRHRDAREVPGPAAGHAGDPAAGHARCGRSCWTCSAGRPRQITCECERTTQPNIAQALHLLNGDFLNRKIADPTGRVEKLLKAKKPLPEAVVEELYLVTLSRPPRPTRRRRRRTGWPPPRPAGGAAGPAVGAAQQPRVPVQSLIHRRARITDRGTKDAQTDKHEPRNSVYAVSLLVFLCAPLCRLWIVLLPPRSRPTGRTSGRSCASTAPSATAPATSTKSTSPAAWPSTAYDADPARAARCRSSCPASRTTVAARHAAHHEGPEAAHAARRRPAARRRTIAVIRKWIDAGAPEGDEARGR